MEQSQQIPQTGNNTVTSSKEKNMQTKNKIKLAPWGCIGGAFVAIIVLWFYWNNIFILIQRSIGIPTTLDIPWPFDGGLSISFATSTEHFNSLGVLFSGLAFVAMAATLILQKKALQEQSVMLRETAEIGRKSLRAQYLSRWLDAHAKYGTIESSLYKAANEDLLQGNPKKTYSDPSLGNISVEDLCIFYEKYQNYQDELDKLTQPINSCAPEDKVAN